MADAHRGGMPASPFLKLLKMHLVAADLDGNTAAKRAGITRSRFYDISCGRARPNEREVQALLTPLLTAHPQRDRLQRLARRDPSGLAWTLWRASEAPASMTEKVSTSLIIDRISLTANTRSERILRTLAARLGQRARHDGLYRERYTLPGFTLQLRPKDTKNRFVRVDLSSSELAQPAVSRDVFDVLDLQGAALTRVDIAVDLDVPFDSVHAVPSSRRKARVTSYWGQRVETVYLFARPRTIRIYDKGKRLDPPLPRTRIEAELRDLRVTPRQLPNVENPFERLALVQLADIGVLSQQLVAREARLFGLPAIDAQLDATEREKLRRSMSSALWLPHPREVFARNWKRVSLSLMRRLGW